LKWLIGFVIWVRREAMRTRKLIGVGVILLGSWFALTPAAAQTKDAASFDRHLRAFADKGDAESQYKLGTAYDEGLGVSKDYTEVSGPEREKRRALPRSCCVAPAICAKYLSVVK
jgi:hypothetical protein